MGDPTRTPEQIGADAARKTVDDVRRAFSDDGVDLKFLARRLHELADFKGEKPFSYEGELFYSKALDHPDVQIKAIHEINLMLGLHAPSKAEVSGPGGSPIQFSDLERANRLRLLIETAAKRAAEAKA
ncbi:MAG: hypothetical protein WCV62_05825 [Candidatus Peribacteraceae bacterium]|jgi:hypothetical protein